MLQDRTVIHQHWFRWWLSAINWTNVHYVSWHLMTYLRDSGLNHWNCSEIPQNFIDKFEQCQLVSKNIDKALKGWSLLINVNTGGLLSLDGPVQECFCRVNSIYQLHWTSPTILWKYRENAFCKPKDIGVILNLFSVMQANLSRPCIWRATLSNWKGIHIHHSCCFWLYTSMGPCHWNIGWKMSWCVKWMYWLPRCIYTNAYH